MANVIIPPKKMAEYIKWLENNEECTTICSCGSVVIVKIFPYYYDEENNDVYFASVCPRCGELILTKE